MFSSEDSEKKKQMKLETVASGVSQEGPCALSTSFGQQTNPVVERKTPR